jgi:hypothetical protein
MSSTAIGLVVSFCLVTPARPAPALASIPGFAALAPGSSHSSGAIQSRTRDEALAKAASERRKALDGMLGTEARRKLTVAMHEVLDHLARAEDSPDPLPITRGAVNAQFSGATAAQSDLLVFYVLADVARITADEDTLNKRAAPATKKGTEDLKPAEVSRLLHLMDRDSGYTQALSAALKKIASTPDSAVKNLK